MREPLVHNRLTIKNTGPGFDEILKIFVRSGAKDPSPFNSLIPMPKEVKNSEATSLDDSEGDFFLFDQVIYEKNPHGKIRIISSLDESVISSKDEKKELLFNKYGIKNWRQWSIANWGTPYEARDILVKKNTNDEALISFTTIWYSPKQVLEELAEKFSLLTFALDAYSYDLSFAYATGHAPDFPLCEENSHTGISNKFGQMILPLSDEFLNFCNRFSKFPIGGHIVRSYNYKTAPLEIIEQLNQKKSGGGDGY